LEFITITNRTVTSAILSAYTEHSLSVEASNGTYTLLILPFYLIESPAHEINFLLKIFFWVQKSEGLVARDESARAQSRGGEGEAVCWLGGRIAKYLFY